MYHFHPLSSIYESSPLLYIALCTQIHRIVSNMGRVDESDYLRSQCKLNLVFLADEILLIKVAFGCLLYINTFAVTSFRLQSVCVLPTLESWMRDIGLYASNNFRSGNFSKLKIFDDFIYPTDDVGKKNIQHKKKLC